MQIIDMARQALTPGAACEALESGRCLFRLSKDGAGFHLRQLAGCPERYLVFHVQVCEAHSLPMTLSVYAQGEDAPAFTLRFGLLPGVDTAVCVDLRWLDGGELFPEGLTGGLKLVCHGRRVHREEIRDVILGSMPCYHDVTLQFHDMMLTGEKPAVQLPEKKLIDRFGQDAQRQWPGKTAGLDALRDRLSLQLQEAGRGYPFGDWSPYGGWKAKKLAEGTGFFSRCKRDGRWWLVDPLGYAFFSVGVDCVDPYVDCRVEGLESWLEWLPPREQQPYAEMYRRRRFASGRRLPLTFSFSAANLYRAFGENWFASWQAMMRGQLKSMGVNTLGNWSDARILGTMDIPYVVQLPEFPATKETVFRDFPDVFSEEYASEARRCARALADRKDDPLMIGYFLRNEPAWAFVDGLSLAGEVLYHPAKTACKERLIAFLRERYGDIDRLNAAWHTGFDAFDRLYAPQKDVARWSDASRRDMEDFSRLMLRAYVEIPARECRLADPNHMNLGMRWAWISQPDLVTGWECFDVFSINCYATDPTSAIDRVAELGVDLPVMIGEFHFGALDAGLTATGLEGVASQRDRGLAYRYYCESVAAHPFGVGCHYFQCYDQFALGRFDGENYNIGLFDICSCAYPEMKRSIRACSETVYPVAAGERARTQRRAASIPMIAY